MPPPIILLIPYQVKIKEKYKEAQLAEILESADNELTVKLLKDGAKYKIKKPRDKRWLICNISLSEDD